MGWDGWGWNIKYDIVSKIEKRDRNNSKKK